MDQEIHEHGLVWSRIRERGHKGDDRSLAYTEFSLPFDSPRSVPDDYFADPDLCVPANPAFGIRISRHYLENELATLDRRSTAVERFGVGDWPRTDWVAQTVLDVDAWNRLVDIESTIEGPVCFGFDLSPDRRGAVVAAGRRPDGLFHLEVVHTRQGSGPLIAWLLERVEKHEPAVVICDAFGPVASVVSALEQEDLEVTTVTSGEHGQACGRLVDAIAEQSLRHLGQPELLDAIKGAATRPLGDAWVWSRKSSTIDISPLVAATLALWAAEATDDTTEMNIW